VGQRVNSPSPDASSDEEIRNTYDSDFSEPSTPGASDSESGPEDINPELLERIPRFLFNEPQLPDSGFTWYCPAPECEYIIDMLDLTADQLKVLPWGEAMFLQGKSWSSLNNDRVVTNFYAMAEQHYYDHIKDLGIRLERRGANKASFSLNFIILFLQV
jgi:hypothetical protein